MGTITEEILAHHCGRKEVRPGEFIKARIDFCLGNDITAPLAIEEFEKAGAKKVFNRERIALIPDHFTPNKDINSARQVKILRDFSRRFKLKYYFEGGEVGIEHALLPEKGLALPGEVIIGADSHTCTYGALGAFATGVGSTDLAAAMITGEAWFKVPESIRFIYHGKLNRWVGGKDLILFTIGRIGVDGARYKAMEFSGPVIDKLSLANRFTMANMAIEAGAKNGIFPVDRKTLAYVKGRAKRPFKIYKSTPEAKYSRIEEYEVTQLEPQVALPPLPSNARPVSSLKNIRIDQVVIGSCTNGRLEDLEIAAKILKGKKVHAYVRLIIIPATPEIYYRAMKKGLFEIFLLSGGLISPPTCGPCLGGHMGILAKGERALATTNRNFVGRMGHPESEVYLAGPAVAAASAIKGRICHPAEV